MMLNYSHIFSPLLYISLLPSKALDNVTSSTYSKSLPTGTPLAILVTLTPRGFKSLLKYTAVTSPSTVGLVAIITSLTVSSSLAISSLIFKSSGPIPFVTAIAP